MGKFSQPSPPSPAETGAAQSQASKEAVRESALVNQIGINSPYGRQFYSGAIGSPDRALNIELTPEGQRAATAQQQLAANIAGFGAEELAPQTFERLGMGGGDVGDMIFERSMGRIQPGFERAQEQLNSQLISQGIPPGSRAWEQAQAQLAEQQGFQESDLALGAELQGLAENRAQRSQAINELASLMQGAPAIGTPATQMPQPYALQPPDIAGLTMGNYAQRAQNYRQNIGGLYDLAGVGGQLAVAGFG